MRSEGTHLAKVRAHERIIHRDNAFGTPEEDAFRRDFTINALFYDIASFSIIDYVGGLKDLESGLIRSIGDPGVRFLEDPVRMMRAVVFAARLDFEIDQPILDAMETHRHEIGKAAPPRLVEEYFKILRSGYAEKSFRLLEATGLLREMTPELDAAGPAFWEADRAPGSATASASRRRPTRLTNAILVGTLLAPLGLAGGAAPLLRGSAGAPRRSGHPPDAAARHRAAAPDPDHAVAAASICGPRSRRNAACSTATSSATRSPGWRFTASARTCWRTGARSRRSRCRARRCPTATASAVRCRRFTGASPPPSPPIAVRRASGIGVREWGSESGIGDRFPESLRRAG